MAVSITRIFLYTLTILRIPSRHNKGYSSHSVGENLSLKGERVTEQSTHILCSSVFSGREGCLDMHISSAQQLSKRGGLTRSQIAAQAWGGLELSWAYTARCWGWGCGCCAGSQWLLRTCNLPDDNTTWQPRGQSPYNFLSPLWVIGDPWTSLRIKEGRKGRVKGRQGEKGETGQGRVNIDTRKGETGS